MTEAGHRDLFRALRIGLGALIGYACANGLIALLATGLPRLGMPSSEAVLLAVVSGLIVFLVIAIWIASSNRLLMTTLITLGVAATMTVSAILLKPGLVA